jgi:selenocysteine lyase/cysteine desulfurase
MTRGMSLLRPRASERRGPGPGPLDVRAIRSHFSFPEAGRIVTNNAASTQPPRELVDLYRSLAPGYENVHRGQSSASRRMTELFEQSYDTIAQFIGAPEPSQHRAVPEHGRGHQRGHVLAAHAVPGRRQRGHDVPFTRARRSPLVAFNLAGRDPVSVARGLNRAGVESRAGCHCATLAHHALRLNPPASCRLSFYLYNTLDEVGTAVAAVAAGRRTSGASRHLATHIRSSDHADLSIVP